jgi:hypothetical protein
MNVFSFSSIELKNKINVFGKKWIINIESKQKVKQIIITPIRFLSFDSCEIIDFINKHKDDNIILYNGRRV